MDKNNKFGLELARCCSNCAFWNDDEDSAWYDDDNYVHYCQNCALGINRSESDRVCKIFIDADKMENKYAKRKASSGCCATCKYECTAENRVAVCLKGCGVICADNVCDAYEPKDGTRLEGVLNQLLEEKGE